MAIRRALRGKHRKQASTAAAPAAGTADEIAVWRISPAGHDRVRIDHGPTATIRRCRSVGHEREKPCAAARIFPGSFWSRKSSRHEKDVVAEPVRRMPI